MKTQAMHTATPWRVVDICNGTMAILGNPEKPTDIAQMLLADGHEPALADAKHIVHCVNTHPELLAALREIALDLYPPTDSRGCCLECGAWAPRNHAEAHNHEDNCKANQRYEKRRNPRDIAAAALASATPQATGE